MKDLRVGERVLAMNDGQPVYTPVTTFLHRLPEQEAVFVTITTSESNTIRLTPEHLIYTIKCDSPMPTQEEWTLAFAREVQASSGYASLSLATSDQYCSAR